MKKKTVLVAMSGGVDSSLAAYFLLKKGFDVEGITMQLSAGQDNLKKARNIAKILKIKHRAVDVDKEFTRKVISYFCREYINGNTPNPCLCCNKSIKFGLLMDKMKNRFEYFATGHYARIGYDKSRDIYSIRKARDNSKDQSYVLYMLNQKQLSRLLLPLGKLTKQQVRQKARQLKLPVNVRDESQDICFIKGENYADFISRISSSFEIKPGDIVNSRGKIIGAHKGTIFYTIGQRKGLGIAHKVPFFVTGFDIEKNRVIVGEEKELYAVSFKVKDVVFAHPAFRRNKFQAWVKIRYHHKPARAGIEAEGEDIFRIRFLKPQKAITPGQGAVFYIRNTVLGGGIIDSADKLYG